MDIWITAIISFATGLIGVLGTVFTFKAKKKQAFAEADSVELENDKRRIENEGVAHDLYIKIYDDLNKRFDEMFKEKEKTIASLREEVKALKDQIETIHAERRQFVEDSAKKDAIISAAMGCKNLKNCPVMAKREQIFNIAIPKEDIKDETF